MSDFSLQEQAKRYLDGELALQQLHVYVNEHVVQDFQCGEKDADTSSLADFLVGIFAEYELDCHLLGRSEAVSEFRQSLSERISQLGLDSRRIAGRVSQEFSITTSVSISAIESLKHYFHEGGASIVQAAFAHTYFVHPDRVMEKTPYYPDRARFSRRYYPGLEKGNYATWFGDGREVRLDDNQYAQSAWERYTGHRIVRGSGYGLRHIWGNPWDPDAFTAGWNFCYMPFWAGMLTERHHPLPELEEAIRQASWDLYFQDNPVCDPPEFVENPEVDLTTVLNGQPILVLNRRVSSSPSPARSHRSDMVPDYGSPFEHMKAIRRQTRQSWVNIRKASRMLQGKSHGAFGTRNVENGAKSCVRKIHRETDLSFAEIEALLDKHGLGN